MTKLSGLFFLMENCESLHWREEFTGDNNIQAFFHFVDKDGPYSNFYMDERIFWGVDKYK